MLRGPSVIGTFPAIARFLASPIKPPHKADTRAMRARDINDYAETRSLRCGQGPAAGLTWPGRSSMCAAMQLSERQAQTTTKVRLKRAMLLISSRKRLLSAIAERACVAMSEIAHSFGWHWSAVEYHPHLFRQVGFVVGRREHGHPYALYLNGEAR